MRIFTYRFARVPGRRTLTQSPLPLKVNLYRLNWWPSSLGGAVSYTLFWSLALLTGLVLHEFDALGIQQRRRRREGDGEPGDDENVDWERKTVWVTLAFVSMSLPAFAWVHSCFIAGFRSLELNLVWSLQLLPQA